MEQKDYSTTLTVDAAPGEVFTNINSVTKWWTDDLKGGSQDLGDEFTVTFEDMHVSTQRLVGWFPGSNVMAVERGLGLFYKGQFV